MKRQHNSYSESFRRQVLEDYFRSGASKQSIAQKWKIPPTSLQNWVNACRIEEKSVSLQPKSQVMDAKDQVIDDLRAENERLRREVEYNKLRVAGYERLLEIIKQEDGIDLLKKDGAKQ